VRGIAGTTLSSVAFFLARHLLPFRRPIILAGIMEIIERCGLYHPPVVDPVRLPAIKYAEKSSASNFPVTIRSCLYRAWQ